MQSHHHHMPTCITLKICTHQSMVEELETIGPVDTHRWWTSYAHVYFLTFGHKPRKLGRVKSCEKNDGMEQIYPWYTVVLREVLKVSTIFHWKSKKLNEKSSQRTFLQKFHPQAPAPCAWSSSLTTHPRILYITFSNFGLNNFLKKETFNFTLSGWTSSWRNFWYNWQRGWWEW